MSEAKIEYSDREDPVVKPSSLCFTGGGTSGISSPADTPGDSGVLCLDSESELTSSTAFMTASLAGAEELACDASSMTRSDIDNRNIAEDSVPELMPASNTSPDRENLPDVVLKALESENVSRGKCKVKDTDRHRMGEPKKSLSEDIVFRRKYKNKGTAGTQKKRVSFHEDILNSTKTDNIHIERGFISYNPGNSYCDRFRSKNYASERYSWCASGDNEATNKPADVGQQALSDIIGYADRDKSGIFEYTNDSPKHDGSGSANGRKNSFESEKPSKRQLYGCDSNSSDSNLSCQSESSSSDSTSSISNETCTRGQKCDKTQKSCSYDCFKNNSRRTFMRKMYFSEADIDQEMDDSEAALSSKQPVSQSPGTVKSALKKKRYIPTNIVEEHKKESGKGLKILPNKNIFDSLKSFYKTFTFDFSPEKGLPEGMEDSSTVVEAVPCESKSKLISKSLDSGVNIEDDDEFVEINLNEQQSQNEITITFSDSPQIELEPQTKIETKRINEDSPRKRLTLDMNPKLKEKTTELFPESKKYIVNGESTVYEHKGVSFTYMHDSFQTTFGIPKDNFIPLSDKTENKAPKITIQPESISQSSSVYTTEEADMLISPVKKVTNIPDKFSSKNQFKYLQDDTESRTGLSKHLASPKKQNANRYESKASTWRYYEDTNCNITETCSIGDNSTLKGLDETTEDVIIDVPPDPIFQKEIGSKTALLNRYLKNVCQKKDLENKIRNNEFFKKKLQLENKASLIYPASLASKHYREGAAKLSRMIDKEVMENKRVSVRLLTANEPSYFDSFEDNVAMECSEKLRLQIFTQPSETLHRMLKVRSPYKLEDGSWHPLLVFITDYALYVAEVTPGRTEYNIVCRLPHYQLDAIAMGPSCSYVRVVGPGGRVACSLVTGEPALSLRLVSSLEWAARTSPRPPARAPAAMTLSAAPLARTVARKRQTNDNGVWFYGQVCSGELGGGGGDASTAPQCDGYLMYKPDVRKRWQPSYFLLKNGVLSWGPHSPDSSAASLPRSLSLGTVLGVRRHADPSQRPHCFELALARGARMLLAAPDEPTASAWLQALLMHAAQCLHDNKVGKSAHVKCVRGPPPAMTVIVTPTEVISLRESLDVSYVSAAAAYLHDIGASHVLREYVEQMRPEMEILSCGSIKNLTAFKIPNNDDNWCVLEWGVCEAGERGAGMSLVLASSAELERLISAVERAFCAVSSCPFPLSVVDGEEGVAAAHARYDAAWAHMLPAH